ncbi:MAG: hypothetical protein ABW082_14300 [Sedimenticola sp.]
MNIRRPYLLQVLALLLAVLLSRLLLAEELSPTQKNIKMLRDAGWSVYTKRGINPRPKGYSKVTKSKHLNEGEKEIISQYFPIIYRITDGKISNDELSTFASRDDGYVSFNIKSGDSNIGYPLRGSQRYVAQKYFKNFEIFRNFR